MADQTYVDKALAYAEAVTAGEIPACLQVRLACKRALDDREREGFPFAFDPARANRICAFLEKMPHTKGKWLRERKKITLEPWQCFIFCELFGWVDPETGLRRFRVAYICVPRKNGKSIIAAGVGVYMFCADNEPGSEVYSGATSEKQAWEVFKPARIMVKALPALQKKFGISVNAKSLTILDDESKFEPIIGNPGDGASPSCSIIDEYHEHDSDKLYDTMITGMGAREQPMQFVITTAGDNIAGPCYAMQQDVEMVLNRQVENERLFGIIYTIDKGDDWRTDEALKKANPNYGVSVFPDYLRQQVTDAQLSSRKQGTVKTKHLNMWIQARAAYFNMERWGQLADAPPIEEFLGQSCFGGMDLASKLDIAAYVRVFVRMINGLRHYYVYPRCYLPEAQTQNPDKKHYAGWVEDGFLIANEGDEIDYDNIYDDIVADYKRFGYGGFGFDPHNATHLRQQVDKKCDIDWLELPQKAAHLSDPMKELEAAIVAGRIHHTGDPCFSWQMSNVTAKEFADETVFPRKEKPENKIDGPVALIMSIHRAMEGEAEEYRSVYEDSDF